MRLHWIAPDPVRKRTMVDLDESPNKTNRFRYELEKFVRIGRESMHGNGTGACVNKAGTYESANTIIKYNSGYRCHSVGFRKGKRQRGEERKQREPHG